LESGTNLKPQRREIWKMRMNSTRRKILPQEKKKDQGFASESAWSLSGIVSFGKRKTHTAFEHVRISFSAYGVGHARRIAMARLQNLISIKKGKLNATNISLDGIILENGETSLRLKDRFANNSFMYAKRPRLIFETAAEN
jgi:hypothetical protein